jgi:hypothetical protein
MTGLSIAQPHEPHGQNLGDFGNAFVGGQPVGMNSIGSDESAAHGSGTVRSGCRRRTLIAERARLQQNQALFALLRKQRN